MDVNEIIPFYSAEEAWFWFIQANSARLDGARVTANQGLYKRPCEPNDILKILERLQRHRRLSMHHFRVMKYYGDRMLAPDPERVREVIASGLWCEAMEILEEVLIKKGIVRTRLSAEIIDFQSRRQVAASW